MAKIAIDICFLLPEKIEDLCIAINKNSKQIKPLGKEDFIPHITLAMGIVEEEALALIKEKLESIEVKPIKITVDKVKYKKTDQGNKTSLEIIKTDELQTLHEKILTVLKLFLKKSSNSNVLFEEDQISETTLDWLNTHHEKSSYENYWPHITLHCYDAKVELPISFDVGTIAICHVGDRVTCRKIIFKMKKD